MTPQPHPYLHSSIGRKQLVAVTGLLLILFVIGHLGGNLIIYLGPDAFNAYAKKLASLRPGLYLIEFGLLVIFIIHIYNTALIVLENIQARGQGYKMDRAQGQRSLAARMMPTSGTIVLAFVVWHLLDFTFIDHHGPRSILSDGKSYGLYGVVLNAFAHPVHSFLYIIAMIAVGLHLSHGVKSFVQTFGWNDPVYTPKVVLLSNLFAIIVTVGYSSIPVYVLIQNMG